MSTDTDLDLNAADAWWSGLAEGSHVVVPTVHLQPIMSVHNYHLAWAGSSNKLRGPNEVYHGQHGAALSTVSSFDAEDPTDDYHVDACTPEYVQFGEEANSRQSYGTTPQVMEPRQFLSNRHVPRAHSVQFPVTWATSQLSTPIALPTPTTETLPARYIGVDASTSRTMSRLNVSPRDSSGIQALPPHLAADQAIVSHKAHLPNDLYTPSFVRGTGIDREGYCSVCSPGRWLKIKNSEYWYDKLFRHGISSATGRAFEAPSAVRNVPAPHMQPQKARQKPVVCTRKGRCASCGLWLPLGKMRDGIYLGVAWIRHAYKVPPPRSFKLNQQNKANQ